MIMNSINMRCVTFTSISTCFRAVLMNQEEVLKTLKNLPDMVDKYEKKYAEFNNVFNPHQERCSEKYLREWMR